MVNKLQPFMPVFAAVLGVFIGAFGGPVYVLIPWAIAGLILGWSSKNGKQSIVNGFLYGFFLAFVFMLRGYNGSAPVVTRLLPFSALGGIGAICGISLAAIGYLLHAWQRKIMHLSNNNET